MDNLDINKLLEYVNSQMSNGLSVAQVERQMKVGKDTIRKKLNRAGFHFQDNQFVKDGQAPKIIEHKEEIKPKEVKEIKEINKNDYVSDLYKYKDILIEIAKNYKKSNKIKLDLNTIPEMSEEVLTRQMRVHKNALESFDDFCKQYPNISKQTLLSWAILEFLNNHK